eukprot:TRINITY_DN3377_c0_g1_i4.p1 TRINITY_DN3377_c0_g1~~TRINITY_DN3377_c0_g1_i4.p1  ORF type:complete len:304 (+),score=20.96 TRINITY_DN3377_c0_g1_i4:263-1174(+)
MNQRRGPKIGDSSSLWNFTTSPGWTGEEAELLKLLLMKLGVGRWVQIQQTGLLPGKVIQQLYGQTQRLIGQQSLAAYTGLRVDIDKIRQDNEKRWDVERKSGLIIWSGPNPTKSMKERWQKEAQDKYGLSEQQLAKVEEQLNQLILRTRDSRSDLQRSLRIQHFENSVLGLKISELNRQDKIELLRVLQTKTQNYCNQSKQINLQSSIQNLQLVQQQSNQNLKSSNLQEQNRKVLQNIIQQGNETDQMQFNSENPSEMKIPRQKRSARRQVSRVQKALDQKVGVKRKAENQLIYDHIIEEVQL